MNESNDVTVFLDKDVLRDAKECLVGAIDQGTSSTRFLVFSHTGRVAASAQMEHKQIFPSGEDNVGWHEHDPVEIWNNTVTCIESVAKTLKQNSIDLLKGPIKAVGLTNQRETTIAWNALTGVPYYNAIVWDDVRTTHLAHEIAGGDTGRLRAKTGLPLASYFSGTKVRWLLDNVEQLKWDISDPETRGHVRFGTIDTWLMYQLTGTKSPHKGAANVGGQFITDVSNASRWLFLDIHQVKWDLELVSAVCGPHIVPLTALPDVRASSEVYGILSAESGVTALDKVPIASILGDQQAALFGQCAFEPGEAKNTYGTGLFLMMNTGTEIVPSTHGLLTTIAYKVNDKVNYALEGSVSHSGSTIQWLRDQLKIIEKFPESEMLARTTEHNDGLYFVPAFAGLFAPHWRSDARACIVGMTATHHRGHLCRAALEATTYQTREVFDAIFADSNVQLKALKVDGGGTANQLMMQFQADMIGVNVIKPVVQETTAMGAAFAAGLAVGVWKDLLEIRELWAIAETWKPSMESTIRDKNWRGWQKAISKSIGWVDEDNDETEKAKNKDDFVDAIPVVPADKSRLFDGSESSMASSRFSLPLVLLTNVVAVAIGAVLGSRWRK